MQSIRVNQHRKTVQAVVSGLITLLFSAWAFAAPSEDTTLSPDPKHGQVQNAVVKYLSGRHYNKHPVDDTLSARLLDAYLASLDPSRVYFTAQDVQQFEGRYKDQLDNALQETDLMPAYDIFKIFQTRQKARFAWLLEQIELGLEVFDFTRDEYFELDRKEAPWAETDAITDDLWRKRLKANVLNLLLQDKTLPEIAETLTKRYNNRLKRIGQVSSEDVFQIYTNSLARLYDPHTAYLSPRGSENFNINMSLSLEGIGALLRLEDEFTVVANLVPAGPADKGGELKPGDKILSVGQDTEGEMVDIIGQRLDDVVDLIRGPKGTIVRLEVTSANDSESKIIQITRNTVKLEEQSAKGSVLEIAHNGVKRRVGMIKIPIFYSDFEALRRGNENYRSTTKDVRKLLTRIKTQNPDGIIIDLRGNGGGSLQEANNLTGLFISSGPTVQVRNANNKVDILSDVDRNLFYGGPLIILINRLSASASEIFAGAIQDYKRGLIVGTQSYGKGTVQMLASLPQGQLKITQAKFYRVSGESTQHMGVTPDVAFPSAYDPERIGESALDNALPWDSIRRARYRQYNNFRPVMDELTRLHQQRVENNAELSYLKKLFGRNRSHQTEEAISLNLMQRKAEKEEDDQWLLTQENTRREAQCLSAVASLEELDELQDVNEESVEGCVSAIPAGKTTTVIAEIQVSDLTQHPADMADSSSGNDNQQTALYSESNSDGGEQEQIANIDKDDPLLVESGKILLDFLQLAEKKSVALSVE